jgi:hypothetical protein
MTELALPGCLTTPLGGYLAGLGLLRAVTRLLNARRLAAGSASNSCSATAVSHSMSWWTSC